MGAASPPECLSFLELLLSSVIFRSETGHTLACFGATPAFLPERLLRRRPSSPLSFDDRSLSLSLSLSLS